MCGLAACCYFLTNALSDRLAVSLTERKSLKELWKEFDVWSYRYYLFGAILVGIFSEATTLFGWQTAFAAIPAIYVLNHFYGSHFGLLGTQKAHAEQIAALHLRTNEALALGTADKDPPTHD